MKGFLFTALIDADTKVRRWAFNSLAQLGTDADVQLMLQPWKNSLEEPAVFEAGLTALSRLLSKERLMHVLQEAEVELNASALLALGQQTDSFAKELSELRLDLNKTDDGCLKQATLRQRLPPQASPPRRPQ